MGIHKILFSVKSNPGEITFHRGRITGKSNEVQEKIRELFRESVYILQMICSVTRCVHKK